LSIDIFEDETRMHPRAMKMQRSCHKCHTTVPYRKANTVKTRSIYFSFTAAVPTAWRINDYYYITLPIHSHAEVTIVN